MIVVREIRKTCGACPAQWEGWTVDGRSVYVRYRWGFLSIRVGGESYYEDTVGDGLHGCMEYDSLKRHTRHIISWPEEESSEQEE